MSEHLEVRLTGDEGVFAELPASGMLVLGSSAERAGLVITGQGVEDAHCAIGKIKSGGWAIKDLGSHYGTLVNGSRVTSQKLSSGDTIVLGSRRLRIAAVGEPVPEPVPAPPAPPAAGTPLPRIRGYKVERLLGRGGMGHVYLAVQQSLNRPVALKLLSADIESDRDFVRRFQSEARAAAAWNHPNVVVVHDVGESDGQHYLSMEFMPGGNLEQAVASQGPLSWRRVLDVLHDAAGGLAYAEAQGILHRDIKPANLMLSEAGGVKIADLGLATPVESQGTREEGLGGKIYGTPHFISPEQARGDRVDHRSDLYSLGATAYRLLSGQTPFQGETTREILIARFTRDPVPLRELAPEIPAELDDLVLRLMRREPEDRFPSADELQREVDRLRLRADHGDPVVIQEKPRSRVPLVLGAAAVVLVVGAVAGFQLLGGGSGESQAEDVADSTGDPLDPFANDEEFYGTGDEETDPTDTDETALENLNLHAQLAYHQIPSTYTDEERIEALRDIASNFDGTDTASAALAEVERLTAELERTRTAEAKLSEEIKAEVDRLRTAVGWPPPEGELPRPGPALTALAGFRPLAGIAFDPRFVQARDELTQAILDDSERAFQAKLARAEELAQAGDFAELSATLEDLTAHLDLPPEKDGELSGLTALRNLKSDVAARIELLDQEELSFLALRQQAERRALGAALGPSSGFAGSLRALQLDVLETQLAEVESSLTTEKARAALATVLADVQRARSAITVLIDSFAAGEWRRRAVADPRPRRSGAADIVGIDEEAITVSIDGQPERLDWAYFGNNAESIEQLYKGRLSRDYTSTEDAAIATLLRLVAIGEATSLAEQVLDPTRGGILQPSEVADMRTAFDPAEAWVADAGAGTLAGESAAVERERKAAGVLARAIMAAQDREVSRSVGGFEHLFREYGDTLVVLVLSDGSGWREEPPAPPEVPSNGSGTGTGTEDNDDEE